MKHLILTLSLFLSVLSFSSAQTFEYNGLTYQIIKDVDEATTFGTVYVTMSEGDDYQGDIVIPSGVQNGDGEFADKYKVTGIAEQAFSGCMSLRSVTLSPSISHIGICAFMGCANLEEVIIPTGNLKVIGDRAFAFSGLQKINIPSTVTTIDVVAFAQCWKLKEVTLPSNLKNIKLGAFNGCTKLVNITFPASLKNIGSSAFQNCESLKKTRIPDGANVAPDAFSGCPLWE